MTENTAVENPDLRLAYRLAEHTAANIFLTGKAGTGKTTFLRNLCNRSKKRIIVAAPTGIAAINAKGTTLHSLLQLEFGPFIPGSRPNSRKFNKRKLALLRSIDMLVIDEISMVRADLLDYVDEVLRSVRNPAKPFGGVQLLLIGDLRQLPPVVKDAEWVLLKQFYPSPYFFHSRALAEAGYVTLELTKVYRQNDETFLRLLNNIRSRSELNETIRQLNSRFIPDFRPADSERWINLTTHNVKADEINERQMNALPGKAITFKAEVKDSFPENSFPAPALLKLKQGAQVMFVKNDPSEEKAFFNGMIGTVAAISESSVKVSVEGREPIDVKRESWQNTRYDVKADTGEMVEIVEGTFSQIPLRPAWAITIHKSQGLTFSHAIIDASAAFAHGQSYVALSRCRNLDGLVLSAPLKQESIITDPSVENFLLAGRRSRPDEKAVSRLELEYVAMLLDKIFLPDFLNSGFMNFYKTVEEAFHSNYPKLCARYARHQNVLDELRHVGMNFATTYRRMLYDSDLPLSESPLQERISSGAKYFLKPFKETEALIADTPTDHDNKQIKKRLDIYRSPVETELRVTLKLLEHLCTHQFSTADFLRLRALTIAQAENPATPRRKKGAVIRADKKIDSDVANQRVFDALVKWRRSLATQSGKPAFTIISTTAIMAIAAAEPASIKELMACKGIGKVLAERHGADILAIVEENS